MKKQVWITGTLLLALGSTVGCAANGNGGGDKAPQDAGNNNAAASDTAEKLKITMMSVSYAGGGWPETNAIIKKLDEKLNIDLQIQWVPTDTYREKLNTLAAANDFPDVYTVTSDSTDLYNNWKAKGLFLDLQPFLASYANLTKYTDPQELKTLNPAGKTFGLPYYTTPNRDNFFIRKDWLTKLNLKEPTTIDEFYDVAKAFVEKDPDGDGKKDTIGFSGFIGSDGTSDGTVGNMSPLFQAFGLGSPWKEVSGKLVNYKTQVDELKGLLTFLRKAYAEGVMDRDFMINKKADPQSKFDAGKLGIHWENTNNIVNTDIAAVKKLDPNADVAPIAPPKGPGGQGQAILEAGQKVVINSKIDAKKQQRILKLLDYMLSDEGYDLIKNGIEGTDFQKNGDKFAQLDGFKNDRPNLLSLWFFRRNDDLIQLHKWDDQQKADQISKWFTFSKGFGQSNPAFGLESATEKQKGVLLNNKWLETFTKIVTGELPVDAIGQAATEWKQNGGDKITEEINAAYQASK